jgi:uncharacterized membrane protein YraQ (UPF0718 family)
LEREGFAEGDRIKRPTPDGTCLCRSFDRIIKKKIVIQPTSNFWFAVVLGSIQLALAALYFTSISDWGVDNRIIVLLWLIAGLISG